MIARIKKGLTFFLALFLIGSFIGPCFADDLPINVWGPTDTVSGHNMEDYIETTGLEKNDPRVTVSKLISIAISFLGLIAVIIILIGGFKWMTAGGNEDQVGEAKKWMYSGIVGLLIILASYGIAYFVLNQVIRATGRG